MRGVTVSTADFGSASSGSNPDASTKFIFHDWARVVNGLFLQRFPWGMDVKRRKRKNSIH